MLLIKVLNHTYSIAMILHLWTLPIFIVHKNVWSFIVANQRFILAKSTHLHFVVFFKTIKGLKSFANNTDLFLFFWTYSTIFNSDLCTLVINYICEPSTLGHNFRSCIFIKYITQPIEIVINGQPSCTCNEHHKWGIFCTGMYATLVVK